MVVGSYVGKSSEQLKQLLELCPWIEGVELSVKQLAAGGDAWDDEEARARAQVDGAIGAGRSVALYTSRELVQVRLATTLQPLQLL